ISLLQLRKMLFLPLFLYNPFSLLVSLHAHAASIMYSAKAYMSAFSCRHSLPKQTDGMGSRGANGGKTFVRVVKERLFLTNCQDYSAFICIFAQTIINTP
ncbi:MAG: hypothetical protein ACI4TW_03455, partial [Prevotella sp.]